MAGKYGVRAVCADDRRGPFGGAGEPRTYAQWR